MPGMSVLTVDLAEVGALIGDPARANMLSALMDGRALTATELAYVAGVAPQTASGHLGKLAEANLLAVEKQGRHRYYRLASPIVVRMLEGILAVAAAQLPPRRVPRSPVEESMRTARTCYDHIAGRLGVGMADALIGRGHIVLEEDGGEVTETGSEFFVGFGVELAGARGYQRAFCRTCLDWSERRPHIAGAVGAALLRRCLDLCWVQRRRDSRALTITEAGRRGFADTFDVRFFEGYR